jgi:outer membrane protein OmpA-like peptidoglycan-associated protein
MGGHDIEDVGPWPAFVDLLAATALLFLVLFAVIAIPLMRKRGEEAGVQTKIKLLADSLTKEVQGRKVTVVRKANFLFLRIEGDASFPANEAALSSLRQEGKIILRDLAEVLRRGQMMKDVFQLQVVGHASLEGERTTNWSLSASRAAAVAQFLVDSLGLDPCKVTAVGRSSYYPQNAAQDGRRIDPRDRRIEVEILPRFASDSVQRTVLDGCRKL